MLDNDAVASPPPQPSIIDSGDKPFAVSNPFEPWSSTYFCPPKRHPRQTNDNAALGHPALPSQPLPPWSARSQTVRFDGGIVDEDLYTSDRPSPKPLHYRKPGERIAQHSQREQHVRGRTAEASEDDESPLSSCGFDGPELLQVCAVGFADEAQSWRPNFMVAGGYVEPYLPPLLLAIICFCLCDLMGY